jgi:protease-4
MRTQHHIVRLAFKRWLKQLLEGVEAIYKTFVTRVVKMTFAQVDAIGQGRVWGSEAIKIGLVDKIGGLDAAIKLLVLGKPRNTQPQNYQNTTRT